MSARSREECGAIPTAWPLDGTYICNRWACDHAAQVLGGYCPCCFHRRMTEPFPRPEVVVLCGSKIDLADRVLVINPGGYIGTSTRSEIEYAEWYEKPIDYLEPPAVSR